MKSDPPVYFDLKTVALLPEALDDAWDCLPAGQQATTTSRTLLAAPILKLAARASV